MASVGVVVIGMGRAGNVRVRDLGQASKWYQTKHVKLIGYVSRRQLDVEGTQQLTFQEALGRDDVHIMIIATENETHFEISKKCIEAGKHVIIEFPLATNVEDVAELQRLAKEKGVLCHEEVISLLLDSHNETQEIIKSKAPLKEALLNFTASYNGWIEDFEKSGSPFTSQISHIHVMYNHFGKLTPVKASLHRDNTGFVSVGVVNTTDGKPITFTCKRTKEPSQRNLDVKFVFEDGSESPGAPRTFPKDGPGLFMKDFIQFLQKVENGSTILPSPEATLHCHQVAESLYKMAGYSTPKPDI